MGNAAVEELIQFQEPFLLDGKVPRHSTLKGTRQRTTTQDKYTEEEERERHHGKNPDGSSSATYHKKEKAVNCNRYRTYFFCQKNNEKIFNEFDS
ncbi:hypothetical protein AVEN_153334-1 [Araneus ventricosus]|uniref:Uncharacterized protein n=1 Tax=Araneus ventricosus TaxID=182803 RepID=A0A4Y2M8I7_ARAVE|nr:hypothetical protein AVEN_153334-1 [Araneus ventricosus]